MPACCTAASEAERAGVFCNGHVVVDERTILSSLGHPQHTTTIFCDDECAVGLGPGATKLSVVFSPKAEGNNENKLGGFIFY